MLINNINNINNINSNIIIVIIKTKHMLIFKNLVRKRNKIVSIQRKGDKILSVFTKTQKQLQKLNENALAEIEFRNRQLALISEQITSLQSMSSKHQNLNNKINSFLND